jgi:pimeloyl-ACP methyl ester carboxylesterase
VSGGGHKPVFRFVPAYKPEQSVPIKDKLNELARHVVFHMGGAVAPGLAGRAAFDLFCRPQIEPPDSGTQRLIERMTPVFARAEHHVCRFAEGAAHAFLWRTPVPAARGRVLLVHGWTGRAMVMGLFIEPFLKAGYDVVAVDLPAHGASPGQFLSMPIGARAVQAVHAAIGPFTGAITHSFGGPVVALAVEGGPPLSAAMPIETLVLIAPPNRVTAMTEAFAKRNRLPPRVHQALNAAVTAAAQRPIETIETGILLRRSGKPALIIHDEGDEDVPFDRAETICATAPNATLMRTTGLGHRRIVISSGVVRAAIRFIESGGAPSRA